MHSSPDVSYPLGNMSNFSFLLPEKSPKIHNETIQSGSLRGSVLQNYNSARSKPETFTGIMMLGR